MNYTACISKNCGHFPNRFYSLRFLRSWFTRWSPLFWLFLRLGCEVMDLCFVHSNKSTKKFIWIETSRNIVLKSSHGHAYDPHWANAATCIHLVDSFFVPNYSCKIKITVPCDMLVASTSSRTFIRSKILWTLSMISGVGANWTSQMRCTCGWGHMWMYDHV